MCEPIAELKQLHETDGIVDYHEKFELVKTRVKLSEEYLVSAYLAGLRVDTQMHVRMFQPQSVRHCLLLGRLYEKAHPKKPVTQGWSSSKPTNYSNNYRGVLPLPKEKEFKDAQQNRNFTKPQAVATPKKFLSREEMSDRRAKGLCYWCDEKFTPEHYAQHKKTQLYSMELEDESEVDDFLDWEDEEQDSKVTPQVSVNVVSGISDYTTMRVRGLFGKRNLYMLLDSGSTHNFMDPLVAEKLGCEVTNSGLKRVTVADGRKLEVQGKISGLEWRFQNTTFQTDVMLIPLQGCDVVLGVQWLATLGPITWEFKTLEMSFKWGS